MYTDTAEEFWTFSLEIYGKPKVAEYFLFLQNQYQLDINFLLFCCWCGMTGRIPLNHKFFLKANNITYPWKDQVIKVIRQVRQNMKGGVDNILLSQSESVRKQIKSVELQAERVQQSSLVQIAPPPTGEKGNKAICEALCAYLMFSGFKRAHEVNPMVDKILNVCEI